MHFTGSEFLDHKFATSEFIWHPFLPAEGIVFAHAKWGSGKSVTFLNLANAIQTGQPFLGLPTAQRSTLFIEADMPAPTVQHRWRVDGFAPRMNLCFVESFNVLSTTFKGSNIHKELVECRELYQPKVVFMDTLRKSYRADKESPHHSEAVYAAFRELFPRSLIVFLHHNRKETGLMTDGDEDFAGFQAWADNANVNIALKRTKTNQIVTLTMTKSHAVDIESVESSIKTTLIDGMGVVRAGEGGPKVGEIKDIVADHRAGKLVHAEAVKAILERLKCSDGHARRLLRAALSSSGTNDRT